jgi:hypothetical protein
MKRTEIESVGVSGVSVMLNHSELVALKGFIKTLNDAKENESDNRYRYVERVRPLIDSMIIFLGKMLPEDIMSVEDAHNALFTLPVVNPEEDAI